MKYSIVAAVAAFAGVAHAQSECLASAAAIPPCALGYLASAAASIGNCGLVDFGCQCSNSMAVQNAIQNTIISQCGNSAVAVISSAGALCSCARANSDTIMLSGANSACVSSAAAIPPCALGYLASAASSIGSCALDDFGCQCSNSQAVQSAIMNTVVSQCGNDAVAVISSAAALCSCVSANGSGGSGATGGSSAAATTAAGSGGSTMKATAASSASGGAKSTGAAAGGAGSGPSSVFTGAAAVAPATAIGGVFGAILGAIALL